MFDCLSCRFFFDFFLIFDFIFGFCLLFWLFFFISPPPPRPPCFLLLLLLFAFVRFLFEDDDGDDDDDGWFCHDYHNQVKTLATRFGHAVNFTLLSSAFSFTPPYSFFNLGYYGSSSGEKEGKKWE